MSIITRMRKQKATWWSRNAAPDRWGKFTYAAPVEVTCRWEDRAEEFVDDKMETHVSRSVVYVDRVMKVGDKLKRGEMASDVVDDPLDDTDAFEIRRFDKLPNFRATEELLTAFL